MRSGRPRRPGVLMLILTGRCSPARQGSNPCARTVTRIARPRRPACSTGPRARLRLLLVALDGARVPHARVVRVEAGSAAGLALAEQVPPAVELHAQGLEARVLVGRQPLVLAAATLELV